MVRKTVVADASPLIAFGRIKSFGLLSNTLGMLIIPEAVAEECLTDISRPGASEIQKAIHSKIIKVHENPEIDKKNEVLHYLGKGEASAIALAIKLNSALLIDEKLGRNAAKKLDLKIIGTAGVLLLAKRNGLIDQVVPLIHELKAAGYYLSNELISKIQKLSKEKI